MSTILSPGNVEVNKYLKIPKEILADLLNWDRFSTSYKKKDVTRVAVQHDIVQVFLANGGMVPIGTWQVDQFLEERNYVPVEKKIVSSPEDPIEVVWENESEGYTRNKLSGNTYRFWYTDSRIQTRSPGAQYRGTDKHYEAILESLGERPGSYDMEF